MVLLITPAEYAQLLGISRQRAYVHVRKLRSISLWETPAGMIAAINTQCNLARMLLAKSYEQAPITTNEEAGE